MINSTPHELSVLITDDIAQNRSYFIDLLKEVIPHLVVYEAQDGQEAINQVETLIRQQGTPPALIIMDYRMPGMNGAEATIAIRQLEEKLAPANPSIIITWSSAMFSPYPKADDWLPKYTDAREVKAKLEQLGLLQGSQ